MKFNIRLLYLYLFSFIGLLIAVIGSVRLVQLGIKVYIFNGADRYPVYVGALPEKIDNEEVEFDNKQTEAQNRINEIENKRQREREVAEAGAMLIIGIPLYLYHWKTIKKESRSSKS